MADHPIYGWPKLFEKLVFLTTVGVCAWSMQDTCADQRSEGVIYSVGYLKKQNQTKTRIGMKPSRRYTHINANTGNINKKRE